MINYDITQYQRKKDKKKEMSILNNKLRNDELSEKEYLQEKHSVDSRYE
ncbi:hypothetical protein GCM10023116_20670 [Kistimonas scapharcae]|uniref:Uncharacterized protein n=1 Tax=Kistimonas scapharcae TaxID=1036133 RepID=A0ABP8V1Y2_9GAMM